MFEDIGAAKFRNKIIFPSPRWVKYLQGSGTVHDDFCRLSESPAGLVFSLGSDHFSSGLSGSLSLSSHGSLELLGNPDVLHLNPLHQNSPGTRRSVQGQLHLHSDGVSEEENDENLAVAVVVVVSDLSERISPKFLVPRIFLRAAAARERVEVL